MRTRGRKPLPTHLKLITGRQRGPVNPAEAMPPPGMPDVPEHLSDAAKVEWGRVCHDLYTAGLLSKADRAILGCYCQAYADWVEAETVLAHFVKKAKELNDPGRGLMITTINGNVVQNPIVGVRNKARADVARYATDLGMTPSSRSRVTAKPPPDPKQNPAAKYLTRA